MDPETPARDEDFCGNNAAFSCPLCGKVFIVSQYLHHDDGRACPGCGLSTGHVSDVDGNQIEAFIEWGNAQQ